VAEFFAEVVDEGVEAVEHIHPTEQFIPDDHKCTDDYTDQTEEADDPGLEVVVLAVDGEDEGQHQQEQVDGRIPVALPWDLLRLLLLVVDHLIDLVSECVPGGFRHHIELQELSWDAGQRVMFVLIQL